jgi:hypothetical protein
MRILIVDSPIVAIAALIVGNLVLIGVLILAYILI